MDNYCSRTSVREQVIPEHGHNTAVWVLHGWYTGGHCAGLGAVVGVHRVMYTGPCTLTGTTLTGTTLTGTTLTGLNDSSLASMTLVWPQ